MSTFSVRTRRIVGALVLALATGAGLGVQPEAQPKKKPVPEPATTSPVQPAQPEALEPAAPIEPPASQPADPLSRTALCHELLHRELFARGGDPDYDHRRPEWGELPAATR